MTETDLCKLDFNDIVTVFNKPLCPISHDIGAETSMSSH